MDPQEHFEHLRKLIQLEEAEEIAQFKASFLDHTPEEREKMGKALLRMKLLEFHFSPGAHRLATFRYADGKPLPIYSPDVGDLVSVTDEPHDLEGPIGTVYDKTGQEITVALRDGLPDWIREEGIYHLNQAGGRSTYKKMVEILKLVKNAKDSRAAFFRDLSLGLKKPESYDPAAPDSISFFNTALNHWQKEAVLKALGSRDVFLVHGPPGTGKTTVLVEAIRQVVEKGGRAFATAPSNTACDQLLECLCKAQVPALRLGHPARIMNHLRAHTLDFKLAHHPLAKEVVELEAALERLFRQKERAEGRGRGISREQRVNRREEISRLKREVEELENKIFKQVMEASPVLVGTSVSADESFLRKVTFDLVVMDEATQAIEPLAWIPVLRAQKMILAGDHFQLPPTVLSKEAEKLGMSKTLFERFYPLLSGEWKSLLKVQYRMHEKIMTFSSRQFYGNQLIADDSVKLHCLADLPHVRRSRETEEVFLFLDTAGRGFEEAMEPGSESRYNLEEANFVIGKLNRLLELGVKPEEIAVISPYSAQVRLLNSRIPDRRIEIDSVDGFQGREKEAVLLTLVRSNVEGELGFLADTRRMNVAMTRAKRKLFVIGDSATLSRIPFYEAFIKYAESIGGYRSVWDETD